MKKLAMTYGYELCVGDKVEILRPDIFHLRHRKNRNGRITKINGEYIDVRPMWCNWEIELFLCEIRKIK